MKKPEKFTKDCSNIAKGVAIILLFFHHLFYEEKDLVEQGVKTFLLNRQQLLALAGFGKICVGIFVIITSYGIAKSIYTQEMQVKQAYDGALKRFFNLMVNFFVMYLSIILVFGYKLNLQSLYGEFPQGILAMLADSIGLAESMGSPTLNQTWWYMDLAYTLIFLVPFLSYITKKIGYSLLAIMVFLPVVFTMSYASHWFFFSAAVGVCAAYGDWFNKLMNIKLAMPLKWLIGIVAMVIAYPLRCNPLAEEYFISQIDALVSFLIIWICAELISSVPLIREGLAFIGKNSLNIFLVHSFFYLIILRDVVYYFKPAIVEVIVLLILSLTYSVILEQIKKFVVTGYKKVFKKVKSDE